MSGSELILVLIVALVLFGGKRMPYLARTAGKTLREFRRAYEELKRQISIEIDDLDEQDKKPIPKVPKKIEKEKN